MFMAQIWVIGFQRIDIKLLTKYYIIHIIMNKIFFFIFIVVLSLYCIYSPNKYIESFQNKKLTLKQYKKQKQCSTPFQATCNKDKIYKRLLYIEERLDKLDYENYIKEQNSNKKITQTGVVAGKKAANQLNSIKQQILNKFNKSQIPNITNLNRKVSQQQQQNKKSKQNVLNIFNQQVQSQNTPKSNIKLSGNLNNPAVKAMSTALNTLSQNANPAQQKQIQKSLKSLNMPSGFVL